MNPETSTPDAPGAAMMMKMLKDMPRGAASASGHYWCAMCKKMFALDAPVCPYMPTMCVNTPIPIELLPPGSAAFYERYGLFYPKLVQRLLATAVDRSVDPEALGVAYAEDFLADLREWLVKADASPLETVKAFLVYTSGFDAAIRTTAEGITFYVMDAQSLWGSEMPQKKRSKTALVAGARRVAKELGVQSAVDLHFMGVTAGPMGRYYCAQCSMLFEFGQPQSQVTCPFMPQKCKFRPKPVTTDAAGDDTVHAKIPGLEVLTKVFTVSPKLYRRQLASAMAADPDSGRSVARLDALAVTDILTTDLQSWGFDTSDRKKLDELLHVLGASA
jgi:hypothetical protein